MTNPMSPITPIPRKDIFIESHSSSLSGFEASFRVLAACDSHERIPILTAHTRFQLGIINVTVIFAPCQVIFPLLKPILFLLEYFFCVVTRGDLVYLGF